VVYAVDRRNYDCFHFAEVYHVALTIVDDVRRESMYSDMLIRNCEQARIWLLFDDRFLKQLDDVHLRFP